MPFASRTAPARATAFPYRAVFFGMFVVFLAGLLWWCVAAYNRLQAEDEQVAASWSQVVNQYRRRADLIPSVVAVARTYAAHEGEVFAALAQASGRASSLTQVAPGNAQAVEQFRQAQADISTQLGKVLAMSVRYPDLKSDKMFQDLTVQLEGTENRIAYARQRHIDAIARYNIDIRQFPGALLAQLGGLSVRPAYADRDEAGIERAPALQLK